MISSLMVVSSLQIVLAFKYDIAAGSPDESSNTYGRALEYTYEYDTSKHPSPIIKVRYANLEAKDVERQFRKHLHRARGVKSFRTNKYTNFEHPQRHRRRPRYSDELFEVDESHPTPRMKGVFKNTGDSTSQRQYNDNTSREEHSAQRVAPSERELIEEMRAYMYRQARDILSSHFPSFPNPFSEPEYQPYIIPYPRHENTRYNMNRRILHQYY